jgi:hypothetical protein
MADDLDWISDTAIRYADDGSVAIPVDPRVAASRLRALDADPTVADVLLDRSHPQHRDRLDERKCLHMIIGGAPSGHPVHDPASRASIDGQGFHNREREEKFRANVASKVDAIMPPRG